MEFKDLGANRVLVWMDEEGTGDPAIEQGFAIADENDADVVLYDASAAGFVSPRPHEWASEGQAERFAGLLDAAKLEYLGRNRLADLVNAGRSRGIETHAWLPEEHGMDAFVEFSARVGADLAVLPCALDEPSIVDRVRGDTLRTAQKKSRIPAVAVDADRTVHALGDKDAHSESSFTAPDRRS